MPSLAGSGSAFDVLWESYRYPPGAAGETPRHVHETYQICLSVNFPGESRYRGAALAIPAQSVSLFHPGEPHSSRDRQDRDVETDFRILYVPASLWTDGASDPFFPDAVMMEPAVFHSLLRLHESVRKPADGLRTETILRETLHGMQCFAQKPPDLGPLRREPSTVRRVRRYLEDNAHEKLSLHKLSEVACLSEYHLLRVFRQEVGMPPHAYQTQIRIDRARHLLLGGSPIGDAAFALGFADQSHFTRTFRRIVGCTPQHYILSR